MVPRSTAILVFLKETKIGIEGEALLAWSLDWSMGEEFLTNSSTFITVSTSNDSVCWRKQRCHMKCVKCIVYEKEIKEMNFGNRAKVMCHISDRFLIFNLICMLTCYDVAVFCHQKISEIIIYLALTLSKYRHPWTFVNS